MKFGLYSFLREMVKYPTRTGSIAPSSEELSDLITDKANLYDKETVVEFGTGTGVFTEKILDKINPDTTFIALEINPTFVEVTKKRCPDVVIYNDSAENVKIHLEKHGKSSCDCIISGLPWTAFHPQLQDRLLGSILNVLKPGGKLLTFSYSHSVVFPTAMRFRRKLNSMFSKVNTSRTIWSNFPPAFIYSAKK
ncbi:MAG: methyltransferase domain-containing protein [Candidatus Dadabacteria bacterium]|nr:methyltransferase domain-containing protein [Candidatus Dadabacteria bacterium]NIQ14075.1 methyltransferase domain-containing protein [Candidatus Dadabacteria bacterium]